MISRIRLLAWAFVAAAPLFAIACGQAESSEASGAITFPDLDAAKKAAAERDPKDISIPWLAGTKFTKADAVKRFGRLVRNDKWENLELLSRRSIEQGDTELLALGWFYLTYVQARELAAASGDAKLALKKSVLEHIRQAVDLGFRNPFEIQNAKLFLPLHDMPEFQSLVAELETEFESQLMDQVKTLVSREIELSTGLDIPTWQPALKTSSDEAILPAGEPALLVVSRIHHDGFNKVVPTLEKIRERVGSRLPIAVAFYQYDGEDEARVEQTKTYADHLGLDLPYTIISREEYKTLMGALEERHDKLEAARKRKGNPFNPFQPLGLFLTAEGKPLYVSRGVLAPWEYDFAVDQFLATVKPQTETP